MHLLTRGSKKSDLTIRLTITISGEALLSCPCKEAPAGIEGTVVVDSKNGGYWVVVEKWYVVGLGEHKEQRTFEFISAFPADERYLGKMRKESALMETKKPQS